MRPITQTQEGDNCSCKIPVFYGEKQSRLVGYRGDHSELARKHHDMFRPDNSTNGNQPIWLTDAEIADPQSVLTEFVSYFKLPECRFYGWEMFTATIEACDEGFHVDFDEEKAITIIANTVNNNDNATGNALFMYQPDINPIEKWVEAIEDNKKLYERLLQAEKEKTDILKTILAGK